MGDVKSEEGVETDRDALLGKTLAQFQVTAKLGQGGMGVVYRATDLTLKREVALKVLPEAVARSNTVRQRFLREARAAAAVTHPCIAAVYEIGEADGHAFIAMELVKGMTLGERLLTPLAVSDCARIARDIARGLGKAHASGVVHRDLKPDNVMLTEEGDVKILDFGIAKLWEPVETAVPLADTASPMTLPGVVMGTPAYMSPEQARGESADARSDVFSFGAMFYEMLTGACAFTGDVAIAILYAVIHTEPVPLVKRHPGLPAALADIVARCLAKDRETRFGSGRELAFALDAYLDSEPARPSERGGIIIRPAGAPVERNAASIALDATIAPDADVADRASEGPKVATEPAAAPTEPEKQPVTASPTRRRSGALGLAAVALVASAGVVVLTRLPRGETKQGSSVPPLGSEPAAAAASFGPPLTFVNVPMSPSSSETAKAKFREAMNAVAAGDTHAAEDALDAALVHDPHFAAAALQRSYLAFCHERMLLPAERSAFHLALGERDALGPRDRALIDALTPSFNDPPNWHDSEQRFRNFLVSRPGDVQAWDAMGILAAKQEHYEEAVTAFTNESQLAPLETFAHDVWAQSLRAMGDSDGARRVLGECLSRRPTNVACRAGLYELSLLLGDCVDADRQTRESVSLSPDSYLAWHGRIESVASLGADEAAVSELQRKTRSFLPEARRARAENEDEQKLAWRRGDFTAVIRLATEAQRLDSAGGFDADALFQGELRRVRAAWESGDAASAARAATAFLARLPALPLADRVSSDIAPTLRAYTKARGPSDDAARRARREEWVRTQGVTSGTDGGARLAGWARVYFTPGAPTREEAADAFSALAAAGVALETPRKALLREVDVGAVGTLLFGAGRFDEAIAWLTEAVTRCQFDQPVRVLYTLGRAYEAKHDTTHACTTFEKVLAAWPHPVPKSISVDAARAAQARLHCAP